MLGSKLKQTREARGIPLSEVEWATKIKSSYLEALEEENYGAIPGAVYARGFLRTYAGYLGLDPDPLIAEYNASSGANEIISTRPSVTVERTRFLVTPAMVVGVALVLLLAIFGFYLKTQFDRYHASLAAASQPTPRSVLPSPVPAVSEAPTPSPTPPAKVYTGVELVIKIEGGPAWLRVDADGQPSAETTAGGKIYQPGAVLTFDASKTIHVISGKANNTFVTFNGQDQGAMQGNGDIADKTYTKT
jgi:cytoskeletal protein RodZ